MDKLDEELYSRQLYVIGDAAMKSLASSAVLLHGLGGVGAEIAKNLVLMGVQHLTICDENTVTMSDLGSNCFLTMEDVNGARNRAEATCKALQEMNSYVTVSVVDSLIFSETQVPRLQQYQVIVLTEFDLDAAAHLDNVCRNHSPPIKVIVADVFGILSWIFCDFSSSFDVHDPDGEEEKETLIGNITLENGQWKIRTAESAPHSLETGDIILLSDIVGIESFNGSLHKVKVINKESFVLDAAINHSGEDTYLRGGRFRKTKEHLKMSFESLDNQLLKPSFTDTNFNSAEVSRHVHLGMISIHEFKKQAQRMPNVRCGADAETFLSTARLMNKKLECPISQLDENFLCQSSFAASGELAPLCALLGGIVSQEVVKATTGKFTPVKQWLHFDAVELTACAKDACADLFFPLDDRYDKLRICLGETVLNRLRKANIFMVGCGAIGCEMLKNYALLGIGTSDGKITITDNDLIEKSNLSRQFLFRNHHVQKAKSSVAASSACSINPALNIDSHQHKVGAESESIYSHSFMLKQDILVNALDNVEARKYMDRRCVQSCRPLIDSGTMGCKGHVQVILPKLTENYTAQSDPVEQDYPVCTIKSFPSHFEHTVHWAKDKFQSFFEHKLKVFEAFWRIHGSVDSVLQCLSDGKKVQHLGMVLNVLRNYPTSFADCISLARLKFEKYFISKAEQLLVAFPLDTVLKDGSLFWHSPRQPPKPVIFDENNDMCLTFLTSLAKLLAASFDIKYSDEEALPNAVKVMTSRCYIPVFQPQKNKVIITDTLAKKTDISQDIGSTEAMADEFQKLCINFSLDSTKVVPQTFEKDNDLHVQFVSSAANLRSLMYGLQPRSSLQVKQIAGGIIPAIASTTSAISGLVTLELIKMILKIEERAQYRNWFLNLGICSFISTEPAPAAVQEMRPGLLYSVWDHWEIPVTAKTTLQVVIDKLQELSSLKPNMMLQGTKIVWIPILPNQNKKLKQPIHQLITKTADNFVEVSVTFETDSGDDCIGPPVWLKFQ